MSNFKPNKEHLRHVMIFLFNQKKKASECHRILVETYGDLAPTVKTCERWFQSFKRGDFDVTDKKRENRPKKFEDVELQSLLDDSQYRPLPTTIDQFESRIDRKTPRMGSQARQSHSST